MSNSSNFSSKALQDAVDALSSLPGIGKRTALRLVLKLLRRDKFEIEEFGNVFSRLANQIHYCAVCFNLTDSEKCNICSNPHRDETVVCVVEDIRDVIAIENTEQYRGRYHVLGGILSPIDGIGPAELNIEALLHRVKMGNIKEVIVALSSTMEGDTTAFFLYKKLKELPVVVSTIARGMAVGDEIEYTDEITLGKSIIDRIPYTENQKSAGL